MTSEFLCHEASNPTTRGTEGSPIAYDVQSLRIAQVVFPPLYRRPGLASTSPFSLRKLRSLHLFILLLWETLDIA